MMKQTQNSGNIAKTVIERDRNANSVILEVPTETEGIEKGNQTPKSSLKLFN